jgi:LysR family transcriptional activator of nhaA
MPALNYGHLRYFRAVARHGGLTRAAEALNVSQSALSIQIRRLEEQLGQDLFERRGRQLVLTEAGRIALDHADAIFEAGDELVATLRGRSGAARPRLRVGAPATLSRNFQMAFLRPLLGRDGVELELQAGTPDDLLRRLAAHRIDVALATGPAPRDAPGECISHPIDSQPVSLIARPGRVPRDLPLAGVLAAEPLLLPSADGGVRAGFDALAARLGVRPRVAAEVDDMAMLRLLAREGVGVAVIPPIVAADELGSGQLEEVRRLDGLQETFFAVVLARRFPNPLLAPLLPAGAGP